MERSCILLTLVFSIISGQIAFPEENPVVSTQSKDGRIPVFVPGKCDDNELYYPGDHLDDWICDCAPSFVYYPLTAKCYHVYKQGPCKINEYLLLKKPKVIPECVRNPCQNNTLVSFNGRCLKLHKTNGCPPLHMGGGTLEVNATTLELECMPGNAAELSIIKFPNQNCPPGSKRSAAGQCRVTFK